MNNELKEMLSAVIREELSPVVKRLDTIETRLDKIDTRLDTIENEQQQIKQAVLETNETVKRIEVIQDQQHRIIELLSARSIEQEAMLKRIM